LSLSFCLSCFLTSTFCIEEYLHEFMVDGLPWKIELFTLSRNFLLPWYLRAGVAQSV
jgi:hypothetical protein